MLNVIIPTYKARDTLPKALDSLVAQTKRKFFVTISQDGDGEDYSDIINEYKRRGLTIRLINSPVNGGAGVARQRGLDASKMFDYVMFLDADDMFMPRATEVMYYEAKKTGADIVMSNFIAERDKIADIHFSSATAPITWTHNKIYRVGYLNSIGLRFPSNLRMNEDSYFNVVAVNCTENKKRIDEYTYIWRDNDHSITREGNFFEKSWEQYILGQIMGLGKILEIKGEVGPGLTAATLCLIYGHMMRAMYYQYSMDFIAPFLRILGRNEGIRKNFDDIKFWEMVGQELKACEITEEEMIFYDMKFNVWLNKFILEKV